MEFAQKINEESVDNNKLQPLEQHFFIQLDMGDLFTPGKNLADKHYRIFYCKNPNGTQIMVEGKAYTLSRGDILLIRPYVRHGYVSYGKTEEPYVGYAVTVSEEYVHQLMERERSEYRNLQDSHRLLRTQGTLWERINGLFAMALEEFSHQAVGWEAARMGASLTLLIQLVRLSLVDPNEGLKSEKPELLAGILNYVDRNLSEKITLEDTANKFFVSASTITHLFNQEMNVSFYKYVTQCRLGMAKTLITEGIPMEKIAVRVGFGDYSAFYRAFKQEFGMSPRQFAKRTSPGPFSGKEIN